MHVQIVAARDNVRHADALRLAFALRHRVFVEKRGWEMLRKSDGLDIDSHDTGDAVHILVLDAGRVMAYARLIPGGFLIAAKADPDRLRKAAGGAIIYGLSRFCIDPEARSRTHNAVSRVWLFRAALDYALRKKIGGLMFDTDPSLIFMLKVLGFRLENIGEAAPLAGRLQQPVIMRVDASTLTHLSEKISTWSPFMDKDTLTNATSVVGGLLSIGCRNSPSPCIPSSHHESARSTAGQDIL